MSEGKGIVMTMNARNKSVIQAPYTVEQLMSLLSDVCDGQNMFSHQDFVYWCEKYTLFHYKYEMDESQWLADLESEERAHFAKAFLVAKDVPAKWQHYLMQQFSFQDLKDQPLQDILIPQAYFVQWLTELYSYDHVN
ncbi:hypothetical protein [Priestia koreensis]|nr:hypothetical protein [Priestia koreensis]MCM3007081.1 hypothetical protein [Priestia koreensis]